MTSGHDILITRIPRDVISLGAHDELVRHFVLPHVKELNKVATGRSD